MINVKRYSRDLFDREMLSKNIDDNTVESLTNDYFICINATGWIHSVPYFKFSHKNVINVYFEDVEKDGLKAVPWYNNDPLIINATACTLEQAREIKKFIDTVPDGAVIHTYCAKGKSRSASIEKFIKEYRNNETCVIDGFNTHVYRLLKGLSDV